MVDFGKCVLCLLRGRATSFLKLLILLQVLVYTHTQKKPSHISHEITSQPITCYCFLTNGGRGNKVLAAWTSTAALEEFTYDAFPLREVLPAWPCLFIICLCPGPWWRWLLLGWLLLGWLLPPPGWLSGWLWLLWLLLLLLDLLHPTLACLLLLCLECPLHHGGKDSAVKIEKNKVWFFWHMLFISHSGLAIFTHQTSCFWEVPVPLGQTLVFAADICQLLFQHKRTMFVHFKYFSTGTWEYQVDRGHNSHRLMIWQLKFKKY